MYATYYNVLCYEYYIVVIERKINVGVFITVVFEKNKEKFKSKFHEKHDLMQFCFFAILNFRTKYKSKSEKYIFVALLDTNSEVGESRKIDENGVESCSIVKEIKTTKIIIQE